MIEAMLDRVRRVAAVCAAMQREAAIKRELRTLDMARVIAESVVRSTWWLPGHGSQGVARLYPLHVADVLTHPDFQRLHPDDGVPASWCAWRNPPTILTADGVLPMRQRRTAP